MTTTPSLTVRALPAVPEVAAGADLVTLACIALAAADIALTPRDVLVFAQKIISKAEGRRVLLDMVHPDAEAQRVAALCGKDPRLVALILRESRSIVLVRPGLLIVEHHSGHIMANAGIDASNIGPGAEPGTAVLLLPLDPDASAARLSAQLSARAGHRVAVVISDSFGRPWRLGTTNVALGAFGVPALQDLRGRPDRQGRALMVSQVALADAVAGAAGLAMGEGDEGCPLVLVRGLRYDWDEQGIAPLFRPAAQDAFR